MVSTKDVNMQPTNTSPIINIDLARDLAADGDDGLRLLTEAEQFSTGAEVLDFYTKHRAPEDDVSIGGVWYSSTRLLAQSSDDEAREARFMEAATMLMGAVRTIVRAAVREEILPLTEEVARLRTESERPVTVAKAAAEFGVTVRTIHRWISSGRLRAASGGGPRMVFLMTAASEDDTDAKIHQAFLKAKSR